MLSVGAQHNIYVAFCIQQFMPSSSLSLAPAAFEIIHILLAHNSVLAVPSSDAWSSCRHVPGPEGVRGRNSDNTLILKQLGWQPTVKLADGLKMTYFWIKDQLANEQDHSTYAKSAIVQTSVPQELGSLREADGKDGFWKAKPVAKDGFAAAGAIANGHTEVHAA